LIDEKVRESWNIDAGWHLVAQMVFGKAMEEPPEKIYLPLDERICIHKSVESIRET
jgi:predicted oxidoreductase (fatty acid repression mutant protein)